MIRLGLLPSSPAPSAGPRGFGALALLALLPALTASSQSARFETAPEFPSQNPKDWIGPPQSMRALSGKVVLLDVWTFG